MRAEQVNVNPYVSMTEIAREKKSSSPGYLIQSWMRSNATIEYLRMWEKIYNPRFREAACDELIYTINKITADSNSVRNFHARIRNAYSNYFTTVDPLTITRYGIRYYRSKKLVYSSA